MPHSTARVRTTDLIARKKSGQKITMLTAYDATMARILDHAGLDVLLVGDSLGMVILGLETTIPVTLDAMIHHTRAVANGSKRALVVADMPFLAAQVSAEDALRNAGRLLQEGGAAAVKIEGGAGISETVQRIVEAGIPVIGHIGLLPQSVHSFGGYKAVGKSAAESDMLLRDARALQQAGAFAVVVECIPEETARTITAELRIPTIGIGSGPHCDGQVLVSYDALGLHTGFVPRFVKQYANLGEQVLAAAKQYAEDVREGRYPEEKEVRNK
jgi:3-methyl-2-oxobutanoate hydroxymethyltransferase